MIKHKPKFINFSTILNNFPTVLLKNKQFKYNQKFKFFREYNKDIVKNLDKTKEGIFSFTFVNKFDSFVNGRKIKVVENEISQVSACSIIAITNISLAIISQYTFADEIIYHFYILQNKKTFNNISFCFKDNEFEDCFKNLFDENNNLKNNLIDEIKKLYRTYLDMRSLQRCIKYNHYF